MGTPCCEEPKFFVYGFWHINENKVLVRKDGSINIHEFDDIDKATEFMKKQLMSNVNITWCLTRDEWYIKKLIDK